MPHQEVPPRNRGFARAMRRSMVPGEMRLWQRLRKPGIGGCRFRRQARIRRCRRGTGASRAPCGAKARKAGSRGGCPDPVDWTGGFDADS